MSPDAEILKPLNGHRTVVFTGEEAGTRLSKTNAQIMPQPLVDGRFDISSLLEIIAKYEITRLMVEGGQGINDAFLSARLIDEIAWFRAPTIIGPKGISAFSKGTPDNSPDFKCSTTIDLDGDRLERYLRVI